MTESKKVKLETEFLLVDSEIFNNVMYAINRDGTGLHVLSGTGLESVLSVSNENFIDFVKELYEVWILHGRR